MLRGLDRRRLPAAAALGLVLALAAGDARPDQRGRAREILDATGVKGGLVVHLGCGDGRLTAALHAGDSYLVHGLDATRANVAKAREHIQSLGLYGKVSVARLDGKRLPYVDNLVNLVVAEDLGGVAMDEVMRVLCPNGVAYVKQGGPVVGGGGAKWAKTVKPRPKEIDEWTHYLHDPSNNAVAHDTVVAPPRRLQWVGSPRWARHHDRMASLSALVSSGGRLFYIFDEGLRASVQLPSRWHLIARDAFNGTILWKRKIDRWHPRLWPLKSGPAQPQRRLVAVGETVYATLSLDAPLTALDAATGKALRTYKGTFATEEVLASGGVLFVLATDKPMNYDNYRPQRTRIGVERDRVARDWPWNGKSRRLMALDAKTGRVIWQAEHAVVPLSLAVADGRVVFHNGERIVCLNAADGRQAWAEPVPSKLSSVPRCFSPGTRRMLTESKVKPTALAASFGATLVLYGDVVLFAGGDGSMSGLSAKTGRTLWTAETPPSGHYCAEDVLVVGGLAWTGGIAWGRDSGEFVGYDVHTGEVKSRFAPDTKVFFMHQRCYRSKATERYLIPSRTGTEFIDPKTKHWDINHWVRGGCIYGVMPCNGLLYATPHSCACYMAAKLYGFNALAPRSDGPRVAKAAADEPRLERAPAYGKAVKPAGKGDWPTYRHDGARSGFTRQAVPARLKRAWQTELGGPRRAPSGPRLSSVVVAGGKLFVASIDDHTVHALDAKSGAELWSYTAGGQVDSPPTVWQGRVIFGSNDG